MEEREVERQIVDRTQLVQIDPLNSSAVEKFLVGFGFLLFSTPLGIDDDRPPTAKPFAVSVEVEHGFSHESFVEQIIPLKLNFGKDDDASFLVFGRKKNAVDLEGGFFDADRIKGIVCRIGGRRR
jgi:hypothetical protein